MICSYPATTVEFAGVQRRESGANARTDLRPGIVDI
jgi:hypothetical protein